jgi:hypothetical protein
VFFCIKELMLIGIIGVRWMSLLAVGKHNCKLDIQFNLKLTTLVSLLGTDSAGVLEGLEACSPVLSFHFSLDRNYSKHLYYICILSHLVMVAQGFVHTECYSFVLTGSNLFRVGTPTVLQWLEV